MLDLRLWLATLTSVAVAWYVGCVILVAITPQALHLTLIRDLLPGFDMTPRGFVVGLVESALSGAFLAVLLVPIHNFYRRRMGL
jgi:hypothetical protein